MAVTGRSFSVSGSAQHISLAGTPLSPEDEDGRAAERERQVKTVLLSLALLLSVPCFAQVPDPAAARADATRFLAGESAAERDLLALGPKVVPVIRDQFKGEQGEAALRRLVLLLVREALERSRRLEPDLRYHGQFRHLEVLGPEGADALLKVFCDDDISIPLRRRAAGALGAMGTKRQLPRLREAVADFLSEAWFEREAGYVMARIGDRSYVDRLLQENLRIAEQAPNLATLPTIVGAHTELSEIYYRIEDYSLTVKHHRMKLVLLDDLRGRVRPDLRQPIIDEIALLHYNLACSLALAGNVDEAFQMLEISLLHKEITLKMVLADGDLRALRDDPRYKEWLGKMVELHGEKKTPPSQPKTEGPGN
ncbi:MAG: hypothetical protein V3T77_03710 [Planctomycetota bacterium]